MSNVEEISLVNKLVKTVDTSEGINNTSILSFMYPDFLVKDEIFFDYENDIIYTGGYYKDVKEDLIHGTKNFICISNTGIQDIDFTVRENIIEILYSKWGKTPKENVLRDLGNMSDGDFWNYFKTFWITGKSKIEDADVNIYNLFMVLGKQRHEILEVYFKLRDYYPDSMIFSSVLSFLEKAIDLDNVSVQSGSYLKLLTNFSKGYRDKIVPIVQRAYTMESKSKQDKEFRTLWLLMQLGKGAIV